MDDFSCLWKFLVQLDHQIGAKKRKKKPCSSVTHVLHTQELPLPLKILSYILTPKFHKPFATTGYGDRPCFQMPVEKAIHMEGTSNDEQRITW
jgi:hypothetical protein